MEFLSADVVGCCSFLWGAGAMFLAALSLDTTRFPEADFCSFTLPLSTTGPCLVSIGLALI